MPNREIKRATGQLLSVEQESHVIRLIPEDADPVAAAQLLSWLVPHQGDGAGADPGAEELDLEESWAAQSQSRPRTSAGVSASAGAGAGVEDVGAAEVRKPASWEEAAAEEDTKPFNPLLRPSAALDSQYRDASIAEQRPYVSFLSAPAVEAGHSSGAHLNASPSTLLTAQAADPPAGTRPGAALSVGKVAAETAVVGATCRVLRINIESTWGDATYAGLSGLQVLVGAAMQPLKIGASHLSAQPKDLSEIGCYDDPRVLSNLLNGVNDTADDTKMWLIPYTKGSQHYIDIDVFRAAGNKELEVTGLRVWNYNKASEQVQRGCKQISVCGDGRFLFRCVLRAGPSCDGVSFGQTILFRDIADILEHKHRIFANPMSVSRQLRPSYVTPAVRQDYETVTCPQGLLWKFTFYDNYNDGYYMGLDAMEFYGVDGKVLDLSAAQWEASTAAAQVQAVPFALQDLSPSLAHDPRTPDRLFAGPPADTRSSGPASCWLTPLSRCMTPHERASGARRLAAASGTAATSTSAGEYTFSFPKNNVLFVMFQHPVAISAVR
jgi:hypothetical protein